MAQRCLLLVRLVVVVVRLVTGGRRPGIDRSEGRGRRWRMTLVGGQLTSVREMASTAVLANANSGVVTAFAGAAAGNGGPLMIFRGAQGLSKLPILPSVASGDMFLASCWKCGNYCSHAKVRDECDFSYFSDFGFGVLESDIVRICISFIYLFLYLFIFIFNIATVCCDAVSAIAITTCFLILDIFCPVSVCVA